MTIGIIFAIEEELDSFLKGLKIIKKRKIYELEFMETRYYDNTLIIVKCGVGKVNAARTAQILIDNYQINYLFNVGVAGGVSSNLKVLDIVLGEYLIQHDFDITSFNHEKGYIPNVGTFIKSDDKLLSIARKVSKDSNISIKEGIIASGDIFVNDKLMSQKINKKFDALCVEMEGASVAQVAKLCNVPFLIIRSISDVFDDDNKMIYEKFLIDSCEIITKFLKEILKNIK